MKLTKQDLEKFDQATEHPESCRCEICKQWWDLVPPVEDDWDNTLDDVSW